MPPSPRGARRDTARYSSRPNPRTRERALASATVEIFYLYLISPLVRRRARCIRMIFIRAGERVLLPCAIFPLGGSRCS